MIWYYGARAYEAAHPFTDSGMNQHRLRILHVVRQFPPSIGGLEAYVEQLASLQAAEWDVDILTLNRVFGNSTRLPPREEIGPLTVIRIPFIGGRRLFLPVLRPALLKGYDVIHIHAADQLLDVIALLSRFRPMKLFMTTHGLFFHTETLARVKRLYLKTITRWSLRRMRRVFAVSTNDANTLQSVGVDAALLHNPIVPIGDFLCEGEDLLYVGRLSANKRIGSLIAFMAGLAEQGLRLKLHIVGSDQENLWPALADQVQCLGLAEDVRYHGYLSAEEMTSLARSCGFAISASRYEGFGLAMIEGMSVGLLPVMHSNDAFKETFERSQSGLLLDFDDPIKAARDFRAWFPCVTLTAREKAKRFAHAQSWDAVAETYRRHYLQD
jgi:alpha-1,3-mannosyltransferase